MTMVRSNTTPPNVGTAAVRPDTRPRADVGRVVEALRRHEGPVLVDLDETLYLRNSTEDFIDSAWPSPIVFLLIRVLEILRPWRLTGGNATRDVWRVAAILVLMPWSLWRWRRIARRRGHEAANRPLIGALRGSDGPVHIVTLGFTPIVAPLIAAMGVDDMRTVAMSCWNFRERRDGKLVHARKAIGADAVARSLVITDSEDDRDLLDACSRPMLMVWPEARFQPAFRNVYLPGLYITRVKRPGRRFIYRSIISDEFSVWVLASVMIATQPLLHVVGLAFLSISFWAIYESGYVDNDRVGARYEKDPVLTKEFFDRKVEFPTFLPWLWAAGCGMIALILLRWQNGVAVSDLLIWGGVLVFTHLWFRLYNRVDKNTRVWFFAGLQMLRSMSFVAVVSVSLVGATALLAHALSRWVPYYTYRATRTKFNDDQVGTTRLLFFVLLSIGVGAVVGWQAIWTPIEFVLLGWFAFKARRELVRNVRGAHLITRDTPSSESVTTRSQGRQSAS